MRRGGVVAEEGEYYNRQPDRLRRVPSSLRFGRCLELVFGGLSFCFFLDFRGFGFTV